MLERIALLAIAAPRRIVAIAVLVMVACGIFGIPVAKSLSAGGFQDPTSESAQRDATAGRQVRPGRHADADHGHLATDGAQSPAARAVATDIVRQLHASPYVAQVTSAWTASPSAAAGLISKDGKTGLIVAGITGGENDAPEAREGAQSDRFVHDRDGVTCVRAVTR